MIQVFLLAISLLAPSVVLGAEPFARATVEDSQGIVPGQQLRVDVDVFAPNFFTSPPQFPLFELPNALVTLPAERSENVTETIEGVQYSGIRKSYAVVPQVTGDFTLPEFNVELGYSADGNPTKATVKVPSVSFTVGGSVAEDQPIAFAATDLTVAQTFDRDPGALKVGDALIRTITITAQSTQAMLIPPLVVGSAPGLHQYEKSPAIEDGIEVGRDSASRRTETYVYTADKDGSFVVPAVSFVWYDIASRSTKTASLPPIAVTVSANSFETALKPVLEEAPGRPPHVDRQRIAIAILLLLGAVALVWIGRLALPRIRGRILAARQSYLSSHRYRLKVLRQTILSGSEAEIYSSLQSWTRRLGYRTLEQWLQGAPADLKLQIDLLSSELFNSSRGKLDRRKLAAAVDFRQETVVRLVSALPPLNP